MAIKKSNITFIQQIIFLSVTGHGCISMAVFLSVWRLDA